MDREAANSNAHTFFPGEIATAQKWQQNCQFFIRLEKNPNLFTWDPVGHFKGDDEHFKGDGEQGRLNDTQEIHAVYRI